MLEITIPKVEGFDNSKSEFFTISEKTTLQLEHSLISLKKWESKWHKPFLGEGDKTDEEIKDYIRCMTIGPVKNPEVYDHIPPDKVKEIVDYIKDPMTAAWFSRDGKVGAPRFSSVVTNEIIYYWMLALNIPVEFQKWHLNQLLTLIKVVNIKNKPPKKMSKKEEIESRTAENERRRKLFNTKG